MSASQLALTLPEPDHEAVQFVDGDIIEGIAAASVQMAVLSPSPAALPAGP